MPKHNKQEVKTYKQTVVNAVILVVILILFLYVVIQISRSFSVQVSTQRTQKVTDITYSHLDGVIFKDSKTLSFDGDIVHYLANDGEKIGVGQAYAEIFFDTSLSKSECERAEARLNVISDRIKLLEHGLERGKDASDLGAISGEISGSYNAYIDAVLSGDLAVADGFGSTLLAGLIDYSAVTLSEVAQNTLSELISERDELLSYIGGSRKTLISDKSFTFYRNTDGYDDILNSPILYGMTRDTLDGILSKDASSPAYHDGCMLFSSKWYLAIPTDSQAFSAFYENVGSSYDIEFLGADTDTVSMTLVAAVADEGNTERSYLLFSSYDLAISEDLARHQSVRIILDSISGYRVPAGAVNTSNGETGVYILVGNKVEFRRITPIGQGEGYYIVNTYENDREEGVLSETPYLGINDLIITSGRDLYDGKLLD